MKNKFPKYIGLTASMLLIAMATHAQDTAAKADPYFYDRVFTMVLLAIAAVVIVGALIAVSSLVSAMVKMQQMKIYQEHGIEAYLEEVKKPQKESFWQRMYKRWTNVVPVEKEKDILFEHSYDGIRELDNSLPPWWTAMFLITIAFAVIYMTYYHFAGIGPSSAEEYQTEMKKAEEAAQALLAKQANNVNENTVVQLKDAQAISLGKTIFETNCVVCHGANGEGGIGPNLTDEYWLHGGTIKDIFKTITNGVPEKGMISWKSQLRPTDIQRVASFILTLQGTNPPNAKAPQGDKMEPKAATESDSTSASGAIGMK